MTINENLIKGKWLEIRGELQKVWGKLTDDELEKTKGDAKSIGGLIQQKYGEAQETYGKKVADIFQRFEAKFEAKKDETINVVKKSLKS